MIKREYTRCRQLPWFTFTLNSDNFWSFYLSKPFLKNINSTCMTRLLPNCFLSWIRFFQQENVYRLFFLSSILMYLNLLSFCGDPPWHMLNKTFCSGWYKEEVKENNAWFTYAIGVNFMMSDGFLKCPVSIWWYRMFCLAFENLLFWSLNSFSFIWYSFSLSDHAPAVGFVSKTPPHSKSDASRKSSVYIIGGGSNFPFGYYPFTILNHLLHHLISRF